MPNILFITANRVGDVVLSTGVLDWLIEHHPGAKITVVCGPYAADLFSATPQIDRLIILKKQSYNRHWLGLWLTCVTEKWDLVIDLRDSIVSRLIYAKKRGYPLHRSGQHKVIENAAAIGLSASPPAPFIHIDAETEKEAVCLLGSTGPFLALGPAANWPCKQWPTERFAELALRLSADGLLANAKIMVVAGANERDGIMPLLQAIQGDRRIEIIGKDLLTVAACLKQARLFIGNDSGLMHIAAAVGTPTLGLFGPGYEDVYGPWGHHCAIIRTDESRENLLKRLPHPGAHEPNLMQSLSVDKVYAAAVTRLQRS